MVMTNEYHDITSYKCSSNFFPVCNCNTYVRFTKTLSTSVYWILTSRSLACCARKVINFVTYMVSFFFNITLVNFSEIVIAKNNRLQPGSVEPTGLKM